MKRRSTKILLQLARLSVISVALMAIMLSGSSLITVKSVTQTNTDGTNKTAHLLSFDMNIPIAGNTMADCEPFGTGKTYYYSLPAVISLNNFNDTRPITKIIELRPNRNSDIHISERLSTAASISPKKAQEFTLVGAKPSGTS